MKLLRRFVLSAVVGMSLATSAGPAPSRPTDGAVSEWREASPGYRFSFPEDHAAHDEFRIEWWYYTGNLRSRDGKRYGYQLTFFRSGVEYRPANPSRWTVRDLYMAHFAISEIDDRRFHHFDRLERSGIGWAGADPRTYRVWIHDWVATLDGEDHLLRAREGPFAIDLRLRPLKPVVLHGVDGFSQKGVDEVHSSHYYSLTRLATTGRLEVGGDAVEVEGLSWMDHEFGTSFLEEDHAGWDWFSIQLDDGRDLMLYSIRRADGSIDPFSSGTIVDRNGLMTPISFEGFSITPNYTWRSLFSGAEYPVQWTVSVNPDLHLVVRAAFPEQELDARDSVGITYWEGSVEVSGRQGSRALSGRGYLEMTGYAGAGMGSVFK